ncbi:ASCH domain-containing protein [Yersinia kristensenii]|nr:ASCH domain-containing protein [Yersinia kristensenii]
MKALSIRQPWAWLIVNGYKDIENRTWNTKCRGPVLIHASTAKPAGGDNG